MFSIEQLLIVYIIYFPQRLWDVYVQNSIPLETSSVLRGLTGLGTAKSVKAEQLRIACFHRFYCNKIHSMYSNEQRDTKVNFKKFVHHEKLKFWCPAQWYHETYIGNNENWGVPRKQGHVAKLVVMSRVKRGI